MSNYCFYSAILAFKRVKINLTRSERIQCDVLRAKLRTKRSATIGVRTSKCVSTIAGWCIVRLRSRDLGTFLGRTLSPPIFHGFHPSIGTTRPPGRRESRRFAESLTMVADTVCDKWLTRAKGIPPSRKIAFFIRTEGYNRLLFRKTVFPFRVENGAPALAESRINDLIANKNTRVNYSR